MPDRFYRQPMPAAAPSREQLPNIGKRTILNTKRNAAGKLVAQDTPLITARLNEPRQWVITLMQAVKKSVDVSPWQFTDEGTGGVNGSNAPVLPVPTDAGDLSQAMQVALRWAAGGASFNTLFDYPVAGAAFGVTADALDLSVRFKTDPAATPYDVIGDVPVVGAFMVQGIAADPSPLRWTELFNSYNGVGGEAFYLVKPYARKLRIAWGGSAPGAGGHVDFFSKFGATPLMRYQWPTTTSGVMVLDVPAGATLVWIAPQTAGATNVWMEWEIGLV